MATRTRVTPKAQGSPQKARGGFFPFPLHTPNLLWAHQIHPCSHLPPKKPPRPHFGDPTQALSHRLRSRGAPGSRGGLWGADFSLPPPKFSIGGRTFFSAITCTAQSSLRHSAIFSRGSLASTRAVPEIGEKKGKNGGRNQHRSPKIPSSTL